MMHIDIHQVEHGNLQQEVHPRAVEQGRDIETDSPQIERQQVAILHQRTATLKKLLTHLLVGICLPTGKELLEKRRSLLLTFAVVSIIIIEDAVKPLIPR